MTIRYKLTIEYDGTPYSGWQRQDDVPSVQQSIEEAIYKYCQEDIRLQVAGRTDAGVHARGQVAHADLQVDRDEFSVCQGLNYFLEHEAISILAVKKIAEGEDFHARFTAKSRHYLYRIVRRSPKLALDENRAWLVHESLDLDAMREAAKMLEGEHDFSSFRSKFCQGKTPIKTLDRLEIIEPEHAPGELHIYASSKSFLHHQVRIMVGTLKNIGEGKLSPEDLERIFEAKQRKSAGITAPACGLYFMRVGY